MQPQVWQNAIESSADPKRAQSYFDQLAATDIGTSVKKTSAEQVRILASLFSGSQVLSELLLSHPDWLVSALDTENLKNPRQKQGLQRDVNQFLKPALASRDYSAALTKLREFKQHEMLRIGARDLARFGNLTEIVGEISNVADVCL